MAFQPVVDTAQADVLMNLNGEAVQNVFYAKLPGGYLLTDLQDLADQIDVRVGGNFRVQMPPEALYVRTEVRGLASINDLTASSAVSSGVGTHTGSSLPNQVTYAIKKTSGLTGRSARGRTFWIGVPDDVRNPANENNVIQVWSDAVVAAVAQIRLGIAALAAWDPVLVSRFTLGAPRPTGITFPWVGEVAVDLRVDTLRGRLGG